MRTASRIVPLLCMIILVCAQALADRMCPGCNARAESERWVYCPFCGSRYDGAPSPLTVDTALERGKYEPVSWDKIKIDYEKFKSKYVRIEVRFNGIQHHFAPVERMGITERDYLNFYFIGNWTNYVKKTKPRLVERLGRVSPYANIILFARIDIARNPGGQDVIVVLVDDFDA